jgi:hypothetical protein
VPVTGVWRFGHLDRGICRYLWCRDARGYVSDNSASQTAGPALPANDFRADANRRDSIDARVLLSPSARDRLPPPSNRRLGLLSSSRLVMRAPWVESGEVMG